MEADAGNHISVSVTYFDGVGDTADTAFKQVTVAAATGDNDIPKFSQDSDTVELDEGKVNISLIYTATDRHTLTYSIPADAHSSFSIDSSTGALTIAGDINYETESTHPGSVMITASDVWGGSDTLTVTVVVRNVEEPGKIEFAQTTNITATLSDPDGDPTVVTWTWSGGGGTPSGTGLTRHIPWRRKMPTPVKPLP